MNHRKVKRLQREMYEMDKDIIKTISDNSQVIWSSPNRIIRNHSTIQMKQFMRSEIFLELLTELSQ